MVWPDKADNHLMFLSSQWQGAVNVFIEDCCNAKLIV